MEKNKYIIYDSDNQYLGIVSFEFPNLDEKFKEFVNSMTVKLNFEISDDSYLAIDKKIFLMCISKEDRQVRIYLEGRIQTLEQHQEDDETIFISDCVFDCLRITNNGFELLNINKVEDFYKLKGVNYMLVIKSENTDITNIVEMTKSILETL
jgi:hypothetical protein